MNTQRTENTIFHFLGGITGMIFAWGLIGLLVAGTAAADLYSSTGALGDFQPSGGDVVEINTGATPPTIKINGGAPINGEVDSDVAVFRFQNVNVPSGVTFQAIGNRPCSIVAQYDMYWNSS